MKWFVEILAKLRDGPIDGSRRRLRHAIERYVRLHPNASDTLEGIRSWWVPRDLAATIQEVQGVLDELVAASVLRRTRLVDGTALYSVRRPVKSG